MSLTIVLITPNALQRFDLKGKNRMQVKQHWQVALPEMDSVELLVDIALRQGPRRKTQVIVLRSEWWIGVCSIETQTLRQLDSQGIEQTLAMEAESQSGIDAFDSQIGYSLIENRMNGNDYLVFQAPTYDLESIENVVRVWGGKLKCLGHPAIGAGVDNLPQIETGLATTNLLIEAWPNTTMLLQPNSQASTAAAFASTLFTSTGSNSNAPQSSPPQCEILPGDLDAPSIRNHVAQRIEKAQSASNTNAAPSASSPISIAVVPEERATTLVDLDPSLANCVTGISNEDWIRTWAEASSKTPSKLPRIVPEKRPLSQQGRIALVAVAGLLSIALCAGHWLVSQQMLESRNQQITKLESDIKEHSTLEKKIQELTKNIELAQNQYSQMSDDRKQVASIVSLQRTRYLDLLSTIQSDATKGLVIEEIKSNADRLHLYGLALDSNIYNHFANALDQDLAESGWRVHTQKGNREDNGLYRFEIEMHEDSNRSRSELEKDADTKRKREQAEIERPSVTRAERVEDSMIEDRMARSDAASLDALHEIGGLE